jgi:hypothetical protein
MSVSKFNFQENLKSNYDKTGPFGDADASRVDFIKLKNSYINLSSTDKQSIDDTLDTSVRVIVGRKGSGKTLYLRAIQDHFRRINDDQKGTVYVTDIDNTPPDTSLIVKITAWFDKNDADADEIWRGIWKMVFLRATVSHLFYSIDLEHYISNKQKGIFVANFSKILPRIKAPTSIFNQLTSLLATFNSPKDLQNFMYLDEWGALEYQLNLLLKNSPPIYFFIDQLDDDFAHAPYHWLKCQYGLFATMFRFIRTNTFGGRLHIIACIRELVYSYILHSQDGNKYLAESKIKVLRWDFNLAMHFLDKKVEFLNDYYFKNASDSKTVENFFGLKNITLKRNNGHIEQIHPYILRHTMLMPRDIINIGNIYTEKCINNLSELHSEAALKEAVKYVAMQIAKEQMIIACILISTKWIYNGAVENGALNIYTDDVMINHINSNLCKLILKIGKDRFSNRTLNSTFKKLNDFGFEDFDDPFNALFLSGLLGYIERDSDNVYREVFFSESRNTQFQLPLHKKDFVFHSSLIDYLNIKPIGKPVYA